MRKQGVHMRICIVTEYFPGGEELNIRGGAEACAFNEALKLSEKHEVTVLTSRTPENPENYRCGNMEVICCGPVRSYVQAGSITGRLSFMLSAYREGLKLDPDAVIGYNFITHPVAWMIAGKRNAAALARYHDVWIGEWVRNIGVSGILGELLERYTLSRRFDRIVAVSEYTAGKILERYPWQQVSVVHNMVDFRTPPVRKTSTPSIACVSRLVEYKRIQDLIRAVSVIREKFPDIRCRIIGTGPLEERLRGLARELAVEDNVEFMGFVEKHADVLEVIAESWVFCLPSVVEGFGIVVVEAMGCGTPFVAARIPPVMESSQEKGGLFFEPGNWRDLAEKLELLLSSGELHERLSSEAADVFRDYSADSIGRKLERVLTEVTGRDE
ncbi:GlcNAc-phosphatidylinositol related biosynthetic protein [Methanothermobacter thermautotrophicus str. Delta H]|uniref:GlcNAc-phosphatidylinositol related biosynthetic protein n=2 Tax=Methanothermobacter thermautotrophicus TaxID=145262 RepID=O26241_METTH|nr:GlcNAc-phosphatidylinositol related biosynthetic protein [Methanothermobacter thermautotrophicus str. Delta H]